MDFLQELKQRVINGYKINKDEALKLVFEDIDSLCDAADQIRRHFLGDNFDVCSIVSGKNGRCSEDCKFCAQSSFYETGAKYIPLLPSDEIKKLAIHNSNLGVKRYSIVTSGKKLNKEEIKYMCNVIKDIKEENEVQICASFGLLTEEEYRFLKDNGVTRIHNNLETSRRHFPNVCTTHTYDDKLNAIKSAKKAGLEICCGGLMGIGENFEDRIDMAFDIRKLEVKSVPVNMLTAVKGTPYEDRKKLENDEMIRIIAIYRFILPDAFIRLAGGRGLMEDKGRACFKSGANSAISGDFLTTSGININEDMEIFSSLGYKVNIAQNA